MMCRGMVVWYDCSCVFVAVWFVAVWHIMVGLFVAIWNDCGRALFSVWHVVVWCDCDMMV